MGIIHSNSAPPPTILMFLSAYIGDSSACFPSRIQQNFPRPGMPSA